MDDDNGENSTKGEPGRKVPRTAIKNRIVVLSKLAKNVEFDVIVTLA